jgi:hypothetical protein
VDERRRLEESWDRTRAFLDRAIGLLPASPVESDEGGRVDRFREWMEFNELELALDELEGLGIHNVVPREFWAELRGAAGEMELGDHSARIDRKLAEPGD